MGKFKTWAHRCERERKHQSISNIIIKFHQKNIYQNPEIVRKTLVPKDVLEPGAAINSEHYTAILKTWKQG